MTSITTDELQLTLEHLPLERFVIWTRKKAKEQMLKGSGEL